MNRSRNYYILLVLVVAAVLRFWGIRHGYPFSYYPDEQHFINRAVSFGSGDFNPHWFHKPAFLMYLLFFEYGLFYIIGKTLGYFSDVAAFAVYYFKNPWPFILIGRMTVTLFGIATVYVTYRIGERFWSKRVGLYASLLLALCYGHIFSGQDVKADVPTAFFTVLSVYNLLSIVENDFQAKDYIRAGLFAGLGTATKYYPIALLPCILAASLYEMFRRKKLLVFRKYIYALISFWGIYFLSSPYNFLDPLGRKATFGQIVKMFNMISPYKLNLYAPFQGKEEVLATRYENHYLLKSVYNYIHVLFSQEGAGIVIAVIFILGLIYMFAKLSIKNSILLSFPVIFSVISIITSPSYTEVRHQLIIYPFLSIAGAFALSQFFKKLDNQRSASLLLTIALLFPLYHVVRNNILVSKTDTRSLARNWIEANIPAGTKLLLAEGAAVLRMNRGNIQEFYEKAKRRQGEDGQFTKHLVRYYDLKMQSAEGITYDIKEIRFPWWRGKEIVPGETIADTEYDRDMANPLKTVGVNDYGYYVGQGYRYAVTSSDHYESFVDGDNHRLKGFPSFRKFYHDLFTKGKLVKEFNADELNLPGPTVKVIKLK